MSAEVEKEGGNDSQAIFLKGGLMKHVATMSFTASIGLMAIFAVDFIDLLFISMLGNDALAAAVGYAGIVLFFTNSIGIALSIAAGSLVAKSLGANDKSEAREYATSVIILGIIASIIIAVGTLFFIDPILTLVGASGETHRLAKLYVQIILPTMPIASIAFNGMAVLRAYGDAKRSMYCTLIGGAVNAALDPFLIFTMEMGLEGAAWASVAARMTMVALVLHPMLKIHKAMAKPSVPSMISHFNPINALLIPALLANVANPVGSAIMMREMANYGTEAVAGMAIIGRMIPVVFSVVFALSGAIGPIVGQNFGAGEMDRVRSAFYAAIQFTFFYVLVACLILFFARDWIVFLFDAEGEARELLLFFCTFLAAAFFFNGVIFVANACFNNLNHPVYSTFVNWGRQTLGTLPLVLIGGYFWQAKGVLIGQAIGGVIFSVVAVYLVMRLINQGGGEKKPSAFHEHTRMHDIMLRKNKI